MQAFTTFKTEQARRYTEALCRHFGPKAALAKPPFDACIIFGFGQCRLLHTDQHLELSAQARDHAQLKLLTDVMTSHLERFAFREDPRLTWTTVAEPHQEGECENNRRRDQHARPYSGVPAKGG